MKRTTWRLLVWSTAVAVTISLSSGAASPASAFAHVKPTVDITIQVNEKGFFDGNHKRLGPHNPIRVPEGTVVRLTVVFDEAIASLAIGDTHQFTVMSDDGWAIESGSIWIMNKKESITFQAGENGRKRYRVYCMIACLGMEHLNNLVIEVVPGVSGAT